jgi:demethylmenaquinone methyltransferase/2-methoxy-6-polyprenyl-1,4-benzoquinol methylase
VEGETVLEIGFGTGHCIQALAQSVGTSGKVHGVDISEGMIDITRQTLNRAKLSDRVELKCGDATNLPYESYSFDAVFMSFTLELFDTPEIPIVLQECQRVLRTDGRICVVSLSKELENWVTHAYEWLHRKIPSYADCRPIFVRRALEEAGFHMVDVTHMARWGFLIEIVLTKKA